MSRNEHYLIEVEFPGVIVKGSTNRMAVKRVQEWINLHRYYKGIKVKIEIDEDFGGITEKALKIFQEESGLKATGVCDELTWKSLVQPMELAFNGAIALSNDIRVMALNRMKLMLDFSPRELGQNCGPWIRAFMHGQDGDWAAWCAGSICTIYHLEKERLEKQSVLVGNLFPWSMSVPDMVAEAKRTGRWIDPLEVEIRAFDKGDLFVVCTPNGKFKYSHIGAIEDFTFEGMSAIDTFEGNTNDEGSAEGFEWCQRTRSLKKGNIGIIKVK
jgi:hypothetical protein